MKFSGFLLGSPEPRICDVIEGEGRLSSLDVGLLRLGYPSIAKTFKDAQKLQSLFHDSMQYNKNSFIYIDAKPLTNAPYPL